MGDNDELLADAPGRARMRKGGDDGSIKMFEPVADGPLPIESPAAYYNNVSLSFSENSNITLALVVHGRNEIAITQWDPKLEKQKTHTIRVKDPRKDEGTPVFVVQAKFVTPSSRNAPLVVAATSIGCMIYDSAGNRSLMSFNPISAVVLEGYNKIPRLFCRGITCMDNTIIVGTSLGPLMTFNCSGGTSVTIKKPLVEHKHPVADIATCKFDELTASADSEGTLVVWSKGCKSVSKKVNTHLNITVINVLRKQVLVGSMHGHIHIYAALTGVVMATVSAHCRPVTGISVAPESAYVLTASEDSTVRVFKLHTRKPEAYQLEFRYGDEIDNKLIVGASFANDRGSSMVFSAYDVPYLLLYKIFKKVAPNPMVHRHIAQSIIEHGIPKSTPITHSDDSLATISFELDFSPSGDSYSSTHDVRWAQEQMGLNTCILGSKIVHLVLLIIICIASFILQSTTLAWTFLTLLIIDAVVLVISIGHAVRGHIGVLLVLIAAEAFIAVGGIIMAIVVMGLDHGIDCDVSHCRTFDVTTEERFYLFWLLLLKGMLELFLCLMIVAMSPIIHDRNQDEWQYDWNGRPDLKLNPIFDGDSF